MDLSHLPWYVKAFLALGGASLVWKFVQGHVPALFAWLTPLVLKLVDKGMALALIHPAVRWFIFGNKANVEALVTAVCDGLERLADAIEKRVIADIEAEAAKDAPVPPPAAPNA
jgi:hypothetical protein